MKILRVLGVLLGLFLIAAVVHEVGWVPIRETLTVLGWEYLVVLAYPLTWMTLNTLGWRYALHANTAAIPFGDLMGVRMAGETFNSILPSSYVGGEPLKAHLLTRWTSLSEAASSVLVAKAAQSVGLVLFIGLGWVIGLPPGATLTQKIQAGVALGLLSIGVGLFIVLLANQSFSRFGMFFHRLTGWGWLKTQEPRLAHLDASLGAYYRECKGRFVASFLWHGVGWIVGMLELVVIFQLMGHPISWRSAWFMGALSQLGAVIGLISPGGLGFYEGGHYMAAVLLGMPPSLGVSASLIRRVREIFWDLVGLYYFNKYSKKPA